MNNVLQIINVSNNKEKQTNLSNCRNKSESPLNRNCDTALSSYLWDLKENHNKIKKLTWSLVRFAPGYLDI